MKKLAAKSLSHQSVHASTTVRGSSARRFGAGASLVTLAVAAALAPAAYAANYTWNGSTSYSGSGDPTSLGATDSLTITNGGGTPIFDNGTTGSLSNAGTVTMSGGAGGEVVYVDNGATIVNSGTWNTTGAGNSTIGTSGGGGNTFTNTGTLENTGSGTFTFGSNSNFIFTDNAGTISASGGPIVFSGGYANFNGTSFNGAGGVGIYGANFSGTISSANNALSFEAGAIVATSATTLVSAPGTAITWHNGYLNGSWTVPSGSVLNATPNGSDHVLSGASLTIASGGTFNYSAGDPLYVDSGSAVVNNGTLNVTAPTTISTSGGGGNSFVNNGAFNNTTGGLVTIGTDSNFSFENSAGRAITAGAGATTDFDGGYVTFDSSSTFNGGGTVNIDNNATINDTFTVASGTTLNLQAGTITGVNATLVGSMNWHNGYVTGSWTVPNASVLNATPNGSDHVLSGASLTIASGGTFNYSAGDPLYVDSGSAVVNNGTLNVTAPTTISTSGGGGNSFVNNGAFNNTTGGLVTIGTDSNFSFENSAGRAITTGAGATTDFDGGYVTFDSSSTFNGGGTVNIDNNATINDTFTVASGTTLNLQAGTITGVNATLVGSMNWHNGYVTGSWTVPNASVLNATTNGSDHVLSGASLTIANGGTFNYGATDPLYVDSASTLTNNGTLNVTAATTISTAGGGSNTFVNNAAFNNASNGSVTVGTNSNFIFTNNSPGIITTSGTSATVFAGGYVNFNDGTTFNGGGAVTVNDGANFNGAFTVATDGSTLSLTGGTFTGAGGGANPQGAVLHGAMNWVNGYLTGSWVVAGDGTLNATSNGSDHVLTGASITNAGTINYSATDPLYVDSGSTVTNNGSFNITAATTISTAGGGGNSFVNNGLLTSTAGSGTTAIVTDSNFTFTNAAHGVIQSLSGTLQLPTAFTNQGTLAGTATISVPGGLTNSGHIAPGVFSAPGVLASVGNLTLTGNYTGSGGTLDIAMHSGNPGDFSTLNITGSATVAGDTLNVICFSNCNVAAGDYLVETASGGVLGLYAGLTEQGFAAGTPGSDFSLNYTATGVYLDILAPVSGSAPVPLPATVWMFLGGLGGTLLLGRRRKSQILA